MKKFNEDVDSEVTAVQKPTTEPQEENAENNPQEETAEFSTDATEKIEDSLKTNTKWIKTYEQFRNKK